MKRVITILMALLMAASLFTGALAEAAIIGDVELTDVPNGHTTDAVVSLSSVFQDLAHRAYDIREVSPDQLTVDTLLDIFAFVVDEGHRPARYFPEETQRQIAEAISGESLDSLNMTEFMRLSLENGFINADVKLLMTLDVDYTPGQLVVAVVADTTDPENLVWTALEATVVAPGQVEVLIPEELVNALQGKEILYSLLTPRRGMTRYYLEEEEVVVPDPRPSITADDTSYIDYKVVEENVDIAEDFDLVIVDETPEQINELTMLRNHVRRQNQPVADWFPKDIQQEMKLLLGEDYDLDQLVVYDVLAIESINYMDTYGDVMAAFHFATPYEQGQQLIAVLGIPNGSNATHSTSMDWALQLVRVQDGGMLDIAFDQLMMIKMGEQPGLLLLLADPPTR